MMTRRSEGSIDAGLDRAFTLPAEIDDNSLRVLYEELIARLRRETEHLNLSTVKLLLVERIATIYITTRWREDHQMGTAEGFSTSNQQRDFNTFWLGLVKELEACMRQMDADSKEATLKSVGAAVRGALGRESEETRERIMLSLSRELERVGL